MRRCRPIVLQGGVNVTLRAPRQVQECSVPYEVRGVLLLLPSSAAVAASFGKALLKLRIALAPYDLEPMLPMAS